MGLSIMKNLEKLSDPMNDINGWLKNVIENIPLGDFQRQVAPKVKENPREIGSFLFEISEEFGISAGIANPSSDPTPFLTLQGAPVPRRILFPVSVASLLPFAVDTLAETGRKLECFMRIKKPGDTWSVGKFGAFVVNEFFGEHVGKPDLGTTIFCDEKTTLPPKENIYPFLDLPLPPVLKNAGVSYSSDQHTVFLERKDSVGKILVVPLSLEYLQQIKKNELLKRMTTLLDLFSFSLTSFSGYLMGLAKLESTIGLFPEKMIEPILSSLLPSDQSPFPLTPMIYVKDSKGKRTLFHQPLFHGATIKVVEGGASRDRIMGEILLKKDWPGRTLRPSLNLENCHGEYKNL